VKSSTLLVLFWVLLAITLAGSVAMHYIQATYFICPYPPGTFSILNLELPESRTELVLLLRNARYPGMVRAHLWVDFGFMLGCYPFLALLCWTAAQPYRGLVRVLLLTVAAAQALAFAFDVWENVQLLQWQRDVLAVPAELDGFKTMVLAKFGIALGGLAVAIVASGYAQLRAMGEWAKKRVSEKVNE